ncbi:hypothetical protein L1987_60254 [Smallanthus sonchifolius]|uniref:Uncharacterized protein n=1 Tax=Smallanthus sonchifolius TaxID=185202 RepID=A0ACB9D7G8_9ASTR|nr:hypothetical protein L1987_60254 [Smallanthus sonchifolius]
MSTISVAIPVYTSDEDNSSTTPPPSPVRVTPTPSTQQPQHPLIVYQWRNRKPSALEPATAGEPARPLRPEDTYQKNELHYGALQDGMYQLQQTQDLEERTTTYVDLITEDLQATDDVHNNLVDLVLEMKNKMADLTRRVEVA